MWRAGRIRVFMLVSFLILAALYLLFDSVGLRRDYANSGFSRYHKSIESRVKSLASENNLPSNQLAAEDVVVEFPCLVEGTRRLACLKRDNEVFMPFYKFIQKQFDATGKVDKDHFEYYTSYSKTRVPDTTIYIPFGEFGHFASYNVETRDRVRCINAEFGVPMSVQWNKTPYFYPIQIAQFALQHYSRMKIEQEPRVVELGDFPAKTRRNLLSKTNGDVYLDENDEFPASIALRADAQLAKLVFAWRPASPTARFFVELDVTTMNPENNCRHSLQLNYQFVEDRRCVWMEPGQPVENGEGTEKLSFVYALGSNSSADNYTHVVLDLNTDALKAIALLDSKLCESSDAKYVIHPIKLNFHGPASVRLPIRQQSTAHVERFNLAAEWFLKQQDALGGWPVPVQRLIADGQLVLEAGWHSAMAQGHAISVLVRAFHLNKDPKFIHGIKRALNLFKLNASDGGVVNHVFGHDWFEEYPTAPGTFVLNGFIYSLIGLFDATAIPELKAEADELFKIGISSLKIFLPLYDSGSGSIYDLRHLGLKTAPNLARWDYHAVHIYLLKWLFNITGDKQFNDVADRWIGYAHGRMAKHN